MDFFELVYHWVKRRLAPKVTFTTSKWTDIRAFVYATQPKELYPRVTALNFSHEIVQRNVNRIPIKIFNLWSTLILCSLEKNEPLHDCWTCVEANFTGIKGGPAMMNVYNAIKAQFNVN